MKKYRRRFKDFITDYKKPMIVVMLILVFGVTAGSVCGAFIDADRLDKIKTVYKALIQNRGETGESFYVFLSAFKADLLPLSLVWFFGISHFFIPFIFGEVLLRGFKIGFSLGVLIRLFSLQGLGVSISVTLLQNLIFIPAFIGLAVYSIQNAVKLKRIRKSGNKSDRKKIIVENTIILCGVLIIAGLCGAVESYISVNIFLPMII